MNQTLQALTTYMTIRYRGCLIDRNGKQFKVFGELFNTLEEAKAHVDQRYILFYNTVNRNS